MVIKSLIALILLLTGCASYQKITYNSPDYLRKATESVVGITTDYITADKITLATVRKGFFATGFSYSVSDGVSYILTNQHVCSMGKRANYTLTLSSGKRIKADFVSVDQFADLCLLEVNYEIPPLTLAKNNAHRGERIFIVGGHDNVMPIYVEGFISGYYNMDMTNDELDRDSEDDGQFAIHFRSQIISAPVYQGASGSPVFNTNKEVIGIVFAVRVGKEHIAFICPISEVLRFLDKSEYVRMNN